MYVHTRTFHLLSVSMKLLRSNVSRLQHHNRRLLVISIYFIIVVVCSLGFSEALSLVLCVIECILQGYLSINGLRHGDTPLIN